MEQSEKLRRSITLEKDNYRFIQKSRGEAILATNKEWDFTTVLNEVIKFARMNGFTSKELK